MAPEALKAVLRCHQAAAGQAPEGRQPDSSQLLWATCGLAALLCLHSCSNPAPGAGPLHLHPHRRHPAPRSQLHAPSQSCDPCTAVQRGSAQLPDLHVTDSSEAMLSGRKPPFRLLVRAIATDGRPIRIRHAVSEGFVVRTAHLGPHCRASQCLLSSRDRGLCTLQCTPPRSSMCRDWPLLPGPSMRVAAHVACCRKVLGAADAGRA